MRGRDGFLRSGFEFSAGCLLLLFVCLFVVVVVGEK